MTNRSFALCYQANEGASQTRLRRTRQQGLTIDPEHVQFIIIGVKAEIRSTNEVGGDHIDALAREFFARVLLDVLRLRRKADRERRRW